MRRVKAFIRKFFSLSRGETNGFLVLVPLIAVIFLSEPLFGSWSSEPELTTEHDAKKLDSLIAQWEWEKETVNPVAEKPVTQNRFLFDPNHVSIDQFTSLGFSTAMAKRIINYRNHGGTFRIKSDLKKIYGMDSVFYEQLLPFIDLPESKEKPVYARAKKETGMETKKLTRFDINLADTAQLKKVYGIGNVLSVRIIAYRDRLGGYVTLDQLKEVYGLDSATVANLSDKIFISPDFQAKMLDINAATESDFAAHPYFKSKLAKAITAYRFQHGNFTAVEDLQKIALVNPETFGRIKPYLVLK